MAPPNLGRSGHLLPHLLPPNKPSTPSSLILALDSTLRLARGTTAGPAPEATSRPTYSAAHGSQWRTTSPSTSSTGSRKRRMSYDRTRCVVLFSFSQSVLKLIQQFSTAQIECAQSSWYLITCRRTFAADGHFENLLEQDDTSTGITTKTWRYGPFITTRMGEVPAKDYIKLPAYSTLNGTAPTAAEGASSFPYYCRSVPAYGCMLQRSYHHPLDGHLLRPFTSKTRPR